MIAFANTLWYNSSTKKEGAEMRGVQRLASFSKGTITPLKASSRTFPGTESHFSMADTRTLVSMTA